MVDFAGQCGGVAACSRWLTASFPGCHDRGYTVSRAFGLLLWGYLFWLLSSLGVLPNTGGGILTAFLLLVLG